MGTFAISIYNSNNSNSLMHTFWPTDYIQHNINEQKLIAEELKSGVTQGEHYKVEVMVESHGVLRSKTKTFCKLKN